MEEQDKKRLRLLIRYRVVVITLFLGLAIYIDFNKKEFSSSASAVYLFYSIVALIYIISIAYAFLLKVVKDLRLNLYLQLSIDVLLITFLVYFTGSVNSNYSLLYTLVIIYSVIFLGRKGGLIVASASAISYAVFCLKKKHALSLAHTPPITRA